MKAFKTDGVYINYVDQTKEGYFTSGKNGKLKKHKYGLLDKLYDIHRYGKTMNSYSYIYFYSSNIMTNNEIFFYMGSILGELTEILKDFRMSASFGSNHDRYDCSIIKNEIITYLDYKNRECYLTSVRDGNLIIRECFSFYDDVQVIDKFQFYKYTE